MKDLITTMAALTVLMVFVVQFASNQVTFGKMLAADKVVENFESVVKEKEILTEREKANFKADIARCIGCSPQEVILDEEESRLDISAPIEGVIACGKFLGISDAENTVTYQNGILM